MNWQPPPVVQCSLCGRSTRLNSGGELERHSAADLTLSADDPRVPVRYRNNPRIRSVVMADPDKPCAGSGTFPTPEAWARLFPLRDPRGVVML